MDDISYKESTKPTSAVDQEGTHELDSEDPNDIEEDTTSSTTALKPSKSSKASQSSNNRTVRSMSYSVTVLMIYICFQLSKTGHKRKAPPVLLTVRGYPPRLVIFNRFY